MFLILALFVCYSLPQKLEAGKTVCPHIIIANGEILNTSTPLSHTFKCNDGFTMYGANKSTCVKRGVWYPDIPKCIKSGCPVLSLENGAVHKIKIGSNQNALISFSCKNKFRRNGPDKLFCDGSFWNKNSPTCIEFKPENNPPYCDFEDANLCGWSQDISDDFDWTRWSGETVSNHTWKNTYYSNGTDQGHYMLLESSFFEPVGAKANLISMIFPQNYARNKCLSFIYYISGNDDEKLNVFVTPHNMNTSSMNDSQRIFNLTGSNTNQWQLGNISLSKQKPAFKIVIQGIIGGLTGIIALDDVKISNCSQAPRSTTTAMGKSRNSGDKKTPSVTTTPPFLSETTKFYNETTTLKSTSNDPRTDSTDSNPTSLTKTIDSSKKDPVSGKNITQGLHSSYQTVDRVLDNTAKGNDKLSIESPSIKTVSCSDENNKITDQFPSSNEYSGDYDAINTNQIVQDVTLEVILSNQNPRRISEEPLGKSMANNPIVHNKNRDKQPTDNHLIKSTPKVTLNVFFIVLFLVVFFSMVLISVVTWKWAKRNQRSKLDGCYEGYENKECQSQRSHEAETRIEDQRLPIRDTKNTEDEKDDVEKNQSTKTDQEKTESSVTDAELSVIGVTELEVTKSDFTGAGVTGPELKEVKMTEPELKEVQVTEPELKEVQVAEPDETQPDLSGTGVTEYGLKKNGLSRTGVFETHSEALGQK